MPCYHPLQAFYTIREDGKKSLAFSNSLAKKFYAGVKTTLDSSISIPCGKCIGCRLERSRQWATRCMHEASLYEDNCYITLTYDDEHLPSDKSLDKTHVQKFIKKLRRRYSDRKIRVFYCGEYGDQLARPHYHAILFNIDFEDKTYWKSKLGHKYYVSDTLSDLWEFGFSVIGDVTFESAAYVARYCTKKVTGVMADEYYSGRLPEFAQASLKPGIGQGWIEKFGKSDVFPFDECVVRGVRCKPPRFYDKYLEKMDTTAFDAVKERRRERALSKEDDNSFRRLAVKEKCQEARMKMLVRSMERS